MRRGLVRAVVGEAFVCPECGGRLRPPRPAMSVASRALPVLRLGVLAAVTCAAVGVGYVAGRMEQPVVQAVRTELVQPQPAAAPAVPRASAPVPAIEPGLPTVVPFGRLSPHAAPVETAGAPDRLMHEARSGQVVVDCTLPALVTRPVCRVSAAHGTDAFSAAALSWLRQMRVQYAPAPGSTSPVLPDHRWRVMFEDFSGQARRPAP